MLKIIFLGTGGSLPTKDRGLVSIGIRRKGELLLFDCGEGTQRQTTQTNISPMKIDAIFITHFHGDHFLGIPGLVQTMSLMDREKPLDIYGPSKTEEKISSILSVPVYHLKFQIKIHELKPGEKIRREGYQIETTATDHSVPGIAYALVEDERPGKFHPEKAKKLGLEPGPEYSRLQEGETVKLEDGRTIEPDQIIGPPRPGRKITYTGDTRFSQKIVDLAKDSDLLIHDATFDKDLEEEAKQAGHSTATDAARVAKKANVEKLVLIHASPRYTDLSILEKQAQDIFSDTIYAQDLTEIEVPLKN
ncbi:ribonuclease Z [candidate division MSBL1 archaeon SCGC-AAA259D14]|uniref:Ribonuclease Z n=2 Tax=candidate division MSBL1 TaxID=215777 RepID=A0A133U8X4_9EURY|nr:ribonuclease Z [candidate division MSBL1 archaeon SCGC-AAA259D14]KXA93848.1 ribonuclease Z [candidate division MSBL1 archaeon SCGC-AAA259E22]